MIVIKVQYTILRNYDQKPLAMKVWERTNQEPIEHQIRGTKESNATYHSLTFNTQVRRKSGRPRNSRRRKVEAEIEKQDKMERTVSARPNSVQWKGIVNGLCSVMERDGLIRISQTPYGRIRCGHLSERLCIQK